MKKVILIIGICLLFGVQSCRDEMLIDSPLNKLKSQISDDKIIEDAMNWVKDNSVINNTSLHESMEFLKWEHAMVHKHDSANIIEVPVKLKNKYDLKVKGKMELNVEYRLLIIQKEEKTYSLLEFLISADSKENLQNIKKVNYSNLKESFKGTMLVTDNKGQEIMLKEYLSEPGDETNLKSAQIHCLALVYNYSDGTYDIISILYCYTTDDGTSSTGGSNIVPEDCECSICAVCGSCLSILKSIPVPGDETEETLDCPMCSCPTDPQTLICNAYLGLINMPSIKSNEQNFSPYQKQFIISLANVAALYQLGFSLNGIMDNLINYSTTSDLYSKYNKLNNPYLYITNWSAQYNSSTNTNDSFISPEIGDSGFRLKYYPQKNGDSNALGLIKSNLPEHGVEWALELLDGFLRDKMNMADDIIYDMHLYNSLNYMEYYCND